VSYCTPYVIFLQIIKLKNTEYIEGDEFCVNCRVSLCVDDDDIGNYDENEGAHDALKSRMIEGPGRYYVMWHR